MARHSKPFIYLLLLMIVMASGCQSDNRSGNDTDPLDDLLAQVNTFNTARVENDLLALYDLHWSGFRESVSQKVFIGRPRNITIQKFEIGEIISFEENRATIEVVTAFRALGFAFEGRKEVQRWLLENGDWFYYIEPIEPDVVSTPFGTLQRPQTEFE